MPATGCGGHRQQGAQLGRCHPVGLQQRQRACRPTQARGPVYHHVHKWHDRCAGGELAAGNAEAIVGGTTCCGAAAVHSSASAVHVVQNCRPLTSNTRFTAAQRVTTTAAFAGDPKGVMITHASLVSAIAGCNQYLESFNESLGEDDSYLSFLPLAHVFDRCVLLCCAVVWWCCRVDVGKDVCCTNCWLQRSERVHRRSCSLPPHMLSSCCKNICMCVHVSPNTGSRRSSCCTGAGL